MKKWNMKTWMLIMLTFCFLELGAQSRVLIQGTPSKWYVTHTVAPQESLYQLSQKFQVPVKELASFNKIKENAGLRVGDEIKIPLNKENFIQNSTEQQGWFTPLYHEVKKGESLFAIGQKYQGVKTDQLLRMNKMTQPQIKTGDQVIVGYLKAGKQSLQMDAPMETKSEVTTTNTTQSEVKKVESTSVTPTPTPAPKKESTQVNNSKVSSGEGYFARLYPAAEAGTTQQFKTGDAHVFKSISGWENKKYYVLMNDVAEGTLVRITSMNNKSVCAKVLGPLPEGKSSQGLILRMSNAAAAALGMGEEKFAVNVTYFQ